MSPREHLDRAEELIQQCEANLAARGIGTLIPAYLAAHVTSTAALASAHIGIAQLQGQFKKRSMR